MFHKILVMDVNLIKYFERRNYFITKYYRSVVLHANNEEELQEIDRFIVKNNLKFEIFSSLKDIVPSRMSYEYSLNGFCVQDSNMKRFKDTFKRFVDKFKSTNLDKSFDIIDLEIDSMDNMVHNIRIKLSSFENIEISKGYFDYYFASSMKAMLKKYNNKYKKKNVISKK